MKKECFYCGYKGFVSLEEKSYLGVKKGVYLYSCNLCKDLKDLNFISLRGKVNAILKRYNLLNSYKKRIGTLSFKNVLEALKNFPGEIFEPEFVRKNGDYRNSININEYLEIENEKIKSIELKKNNLGKLRKCAKCDADLESMDLRVNSCKNCRGKRKKSGKHCGHCNKFFIPQQGHQKYCSVRCRRQAFYERMKKSVYKKCLSCEATFKPLPDSINQAFCSTSCRIKFRTEKESNNASVINDTCHNCGKNIPLNSPYNNFCSNLCNKNFHKLVRRDKQAKG